MVELIVIINYVILCYFIFSIIVYSSLLISSFPEIVKFYNISRFSNVYTFINKAHLPPVTVIMPVFNAEKTIVNAIYSALNSKYPNLYVIAILDGISDDLTFEKIQESFDIEEINLSIEETIKTKPVIRSFISRSHPNLMFIQKEHGGTGDSLNVGLNICYTPFLVTLDSDSVVEPDAISEFMNFVMTNNHTVAVGGGVYLLNNCKVEQGKIIEINLPKKWISALQINEYIRSHLFNRTAWNRFGGTMSYAGTATLFYRPMLLQINGFDTQNYSQDAEVIIHLHQKLSVEKIPYKIGFTPDAGVWTQVPDTIRSYTVQQNHWRRGLLRSTFRYWTMFFNPRYKIKGLMGYPFYVLLEILGPYFEFTAYFTVIISYFIGILDGYLAVMYGVLAWGFSAYLNVANAFINLITFNRYKRLNDVLKIFALTCAEMLGFRQYLTVVKVYSSVQYFFYRLIGRPQ